MSDNAGFSEKRYTIQVYEVCFERRVMGSEWKKGAGDTSEEYGYTPETVNTQQVKREIYSQNVEELDLKEVIKAVNKLDDPDYKRCLSHERG